MSKRTVTTIALKIVAVLAMVRSMEWAASRGQFASPSPQELTFWFLLPILVTIACAAIILKVAGRVAALGAGPMDDTDDQLESWLCLVALKGLGLWLFVGVFARIPDIPISPREWSPGFAYTAGHVLPLVVGLVCSILLIWTPPYLLRLLGYRRPTIDDHP